jgi:hypothetical protein
MNPAGDATYVSQILSRAGYDYRGSWQSQGQTWDDLVQQMWQTYR